MDNVGPAVRGLLTTLVVSVVLCAGGVSGQSQEAPSASLAKAVGTVKTISGSTITLTTDAGSAVNVQIQDSTRLVRTAPGQKDLKGATSIRLQEIEVGDRMLVRGKTSEDGISLVASAAIVIKGADIAARQEQERQDWQKRGVAGLVTAVDGSNGAVTVAMSSFGGSKSVAIHISKDTIIRRYAPDSVKFDDATAGTFQQIKAGDQLRARGTRSADGSELTAEEIVSGTFRNIAGTVIAADATNNSVSVMDLITKKQVTLKVTADSQLRNLPPMIAQRIAMRLKGGPPQAAQGNGANGNGPPAGQGAEERRPAEMGGRRPGGPPDFQQMLARMPAVSLSDLQKGNPVMVVATEGTASSPPTAITLLTGVEPILTAAPDSTRAAMLLSPWNLGGGGAEAAAGGANP